MPDVFQVLKADHDEVKAMLARLEEGPKATGGASAGQLAERQRLAEEVIISEAKHEATEQQFFWPAVRELGPEGDRVADEGTGQEQEGEQVLYELARLNPDDERFEKLLAVFTSAARAHIAFEEAHAWPLLRASISADRATQLGDKITQAKKLAPTRPHPHTPPNEGAAKTAGPMAGVADRLRDAVTGRGGKELAAGNPLDAPRPGTPHPGRGVFCPPAEVGGSTLPDENNRTPSSSPTWSTRPSRSRTAAFRRRRPRMTTSGTSRY